jgi:hypothetical protein
VESGGRQRHACGSEINARLKERATNHGPRRPATRREMVPDTFLFPLKGWRAEPELDYRSSMASRVPIATIPPRIRIASKRGRNSLIECIHLLYTKRTSESAFRQTRMSPRAGADHIPRMKGAGSLKLRTLSPFGGVYGTGGSSVSVKSGPPQPDPVYVLSRTVCLGLDTLSYRFSKPASI